MSINSGVQLENEAKESDKSDEKIEIEDSSRPDLKKRANSNFGDLNIKYTQKNLMK